MMSKKILYFLATMGFLIGILFPWNPWSQGRESRADYEAMDDPYDVLKSYHTYANQRFNEGLEVIFNPEKEKSDPANDDCADPYTTYCIALDLNHELLQAQQRLMDLKTSVRVHSEYGLIESMQLELEEESLRMEDALDLSLEVYDQIRFVYPLHVQLVGNSKEDTHNLRYHLENNIRGLARLRRLFEYYPHAFQDVTSLSCQ